MKLKSKISSQSCPKGKWQKTSEVEVRTDIPEEIIKELQDLMPNIIRGKAKDQMVKRKLIELYNTIFNQNYSTGTNCSSCLSTMYKGIKKIHEQYSENN